jgi:hypothetical protein
VVEVVKFAAEDVTDVLDLDTLKNKSSSFRLTPSIAMTELPTYKRADPIAWAERHIQLDYGFFRRENHPLMIEPLRAAARSRGVYVGLIGSVQHIKTLTAQILQLYGLHVMPCNAAH